MPSSHRRGRRREMLPGQPARNRLLSVGSDQVSTSSLFSSAESRSRGRLFVFVVAGRAPSRASRANADQAATAGSDRAPVIRACTRVASIDTRSLTPA